MYITTVKFPNYVRPEGVFPVLALDPGKTIGVAWATIQTCRTITTTTITVETFTWPWPDILTANNLQDYINQAGTVTAENFKIYPFKARALSWDGLPAARVLGYVEGLCLMRGKTLHSKMAAQAKEMFPDEFLKEHMTGGSVPRNRHERDALRHLWLTLFDLREKD